MERAALSGAALFIKKTAQKHGWASVSVSIAGYKTIRQSEDRHQMTEAALHTPSFRVERSEIEKSPRITQPGAIVRKGIRHTARLSSIFYFLSSIFYLPMSDTPPV